METVKKKLSIVSENIIPKTLIYILGIIIFFGYWHFFGVSNAIVGFIVVHASTMLFKKDLTATPLKNIFKFLFIYLFIGIFTYLAALNIYVGFFIDFFCIFFMAYTLFYDLKTTILPPFLLAYLILLKDPVTIEKLPIRLLGLAIGALFLIISQLIINAHRSRNDLRDNLIKLVKEISIKIDVLINDKNVRYDYVNVEKYIDNIVNIINERKDNFFYLNDLDNVRLNFSLYIERLNYSMDELYHPVHDKVYRDFLQDLSGVTNKIIKFIETENAAYKLIDEIDAFNNKYKSLLSYNYSAYEIIQNMNMLKFSLSNFINERKKHKFNITNYIQIPKATKLKNIFKFNFNFKSLKFTYAFRLAFLISASYFAVKLLNVPFGYWITITLFAVVQPYAETSKERFLLRFKGTIVGIIIFTLIMVFIPWLYVKVTLYLLLYYAYLFFDDYDSKIACITPIALGVFVLLGDNAYETSFYRFIYMAIGILIGYLGTKYLFPYNTLDSLKNFTKSYFNLSKDTIDYAFKNKIDDDLLLELNKRLLKGKLYEEKILLNNGKNNVKYIKEFTYNQRILMNHIYFLFYSLNKKQVYSEILDKLKAQFDDITKDNLMMYMNYDEEEFLKQLKIENKNYFDSINNYEYKLVLINLYRIYSRLEVSKNLREKIDIIILSYY